MNTGFIYSKSALWVQDNTRVAGVKSLTPPALTAQIGNYQSSWMDAPIPVDNGMQAMQLEYKVDCDASVLGLFGMISGANTRAQVRRTYRGTDRVLHTWVEEFEGIIGTITPDESSNDSKENVGMSVTMNLSYYKLTIDGAEIYEIDPLNLIRSVNGTNQLADEKSALNL